MAKPKLVKTKMDNILYALVLKSDYQILAIWAADCAERVLKYFEKNFPQDIRPREAIAAARAWARGEIKMMAARKCAIASHAAARDAEKNPESEAAARSAGHAAATAHVGRHAFAASTYALSAIRDASSSSDYEINQQIDKERKWQYHQFFELQRKM